MTYTQKNLVTEIFIKVPYDKRRKKISSIKLGLSISL